MRCIRIPFTATDNAGLVHRVDMDHTCPVDPSLRGPLTIALPTRRAVLTANDDTRHTVAMGIFSDGRLAMWAKRRQGRRAEQERRLADAAVDEDDARAHARRAEKASYLTEKLEQRERSERSRD
jgi:hypothetical protein